MSANTLHGKSRNRLTTQKSMQLLTNDTSYKVTDNLRSEYNGISMKDLAKMYNVHNSHEFFGVQGYSMPKQNKSEPNVMNFKGTYVKYHDDIKPKPREYIHQIQERAKQVPDPRKYSKLKIWTEKIHGCQKWYNDHPRQTIFNAVAKESKSKPGPNHYNSLNSLKKLWKVHGIAKR